MASVALDPASFAVDVPYAGRFAGQLSGSNDSPRISLSETFLGHLGIANATVDNLLHRSLKRAVVGWIADY
jgi:hypothetical protein